jgi:hypothetical protein
MFTLSIHHSISERNPRTAGRHFFLRALSLLILCLTPLMADIQSPRGKKDADKKELQRDEDRLKRILSVPTPQPLSVRVLRGQSTTIPLRVVTASNQRVEFRLSDEPTAGSLSPIRPSTKRDQVTVTYTAAAESTAMSDRFSFRARHAAGEMSGSATVTIEIINPTPELTFIEEIDFTPTIVGEISERSVTITNRGTGTFSEKLSLAPPFHLVEKNATLTIPAGQSRELKIAFMPWAATAEEKKLSFESGTTRTIKFRALGVVPIQAEPALIKIEERPKGELRTSTVTITSAAKEPVDVSIAPIKGITIEPVWLKLPPKGQQTVKLSLPLEEKREVRGLLVLSARGTQLEVPVYGPARPALLVWNKPDDQTTLSLPQLPDSATFEITNIGGEQTPVFVETPQTIKIENLENGATIDPDRPIKVTARLQKSTETLPGGEIRLNYGTRQLVLPFTIDTPAEDSAAEAKKALLNQTTYTNGQKPSGSAALSLSDEEKNRRDILSIYGIFMGPIEFNDALVCPPQIFIDTKKITQTGFQLAWNEPPPGNYKYQIFREDLKPLAKNEPPVRQWVRWDENITYSRENGKVVATFAGLPSLRRFTMRVSTMAPDGKLSKASDPFFVSTKAPRSYMKYLYGTLALAALFGIWRWQRRRMYDY